MKREEGNTCVFCGTAENLHPTEKMVALWSEIENTEMCSQCLNGMENRAVVEWLRWLRRNNPMHWQQVVDNHRFDSTTLANVIRQIRIE